MPTNLADITPHVPKLKQPSNRTWAYRGVRAVTAAVQRWCGSHELSLSALEASVLRQFGSEAFEDTSFREPMSILLSGLAETARLNSVGRYAAYQSLRRILFNRLSLERAWREAAPDGGREAGPAVTRPLYVLGLPRTGTTLLFNLLSCDPQSRPLLFWESQYPVFAPDCRNGYSVKSRQWQAARRIAMLGRLAPDLSSIHKIDPFGPEECLWLMENTLHSQSFLLMWEIPEYGDWLRSRTAEQWEIAYRHYVDTLRLLQRDTSDRRFVLKFPLHTPHVSTILKLIPDACFVQTHREVTEVAASCCSLGYETRRIMSDVVDPVAVGREILDTLSETALKGATASAEHPGRVLDIHYEHLVKAPIATVRAIYEYFGLTLTAAAEQQMQRWLDSNPKGRHGQHTYSLEQFGLDRTTVEARCDAYRPVEQRLSSKLKKPSDCSDSDRMEARPVQAPVPDRTPIR